MSAPSMIAKERIRAPIPTRELKRRWSAVRLAMKAEGIGALVLQNDNQYLGGYVRYFIDIPTEQAYPMSVVFPVDEEMTVVSSGGPPLPPSPPEWAVRGVKNRVGLPYFRTLHYTNRLDAEEIVKALKRRNDKKIGVVGLGAMHAAFYQYLKDHLSGVEIVEATDLVDRIKAVKSEDELVYVRQAMETQDMVFAAAPTIIRPGKYEYEVRADIAGLLTILGSEEQLIMMSSAPPGQKAGNIHSFYQNRQIQAGDQICIMIEPNGPGGFYGELSRTWVLGEPPKELLALWDVALEAQKRAAALSKPGVNPGTIFQKHNEFITGKGYQPEGRLFAHGQGYDLVERPAYRLEEDMVLAKNMVVAIHPFAATDTAFGFCCDDFIITEQGAQRLHKTEQKIIVIPC